MGDERCETCRYWKTEDTKVERLEVQGVCRFWPPIAYGVGGHAQWLLPATSPDHWCGQWKEK